MEQLLDFLAAPAVQPRLVEEAVAARQRRSEMRVEGLSHLNRELSGGTPAVRAEALRVLADALAEHHYYDAVYACSPDVAASLQEGVYAIVRELVTPLAHLTAAPREELSRGYDILRLLHCRWAPFDFAFLRAVDLPSVLFSLWSVWDRSGGERPETEGERKAREASQRGSDDPAWSPGGDYAAEPLDAVVQAASGLFRSTALRAAMALAGGGADPGVARAGRQYLAQSLDCVTQDLRRSLDYLRRPCAAAEPAAEEARRRHIYHCETLLGFMGVALQAVCTPDAGSAGPPAPAAGAPAAGGAPAAAPVDATGVAEALPLLVLCLTLSPHSAEDSSGCRRMAESAAVSLRRLLPHVTVAAAEQAVGPVLPAELLPACPSVEIPPEPPESPLLEGAKQRPAGGSARRADVIAPAAGAGAAKAQRVVRLLAALGSGTMLSGEAAASPVVAAEARAVLRLLFLRNRQWAPHVAAWLRGALSPAAMEKVLGESGGLRSVEARAAAAALQVVGGGPEAPRAGQAAEHCPPGQRVQVPVVVLRVAGDTASVIPADLGLSSDVKEVALDDLCPAPDPLRGEIDRPLMPTLVGLLRVLLPALQPAGESDPDKLPSGFPRDASRCATLSFVAARALRCLSVYLPPSDLAREFLEAYPGGPAALGALARGRVLVPSALPHLEEKALVWAEALRAAEALCSGEQAPAAEAAAAPAAPSPSHDESAQQQQLDGDFEAAPLACGPPAEDAAGRGQGGAQGAPGPAADLATAAGLPAARSPKSRHSEAEQRKIDAAEQLCRAFAGLPFPLCYGALELAKGDGDKAAQLLMDSIEASALGGKGNSNSAAASSSAAATTRHLARAQPPTPAAAPASPTAAGGSGAAAAAGRAQGQHPGRRPPPLSYGVSFGGGAAGCVKASCAPVADPDGRGGFTVEIMFRVCGEGPHGALAPGPEASPDEPPGTLPLVRGDGGPPGDGGTFRADILPRKVRIVWADVVCELRMAPPVAPNSPVWCHLLVNVDPAEGGMVTLLTGSATLLHRSERASSDPPPRPPQHWTIGPGSAPGGARQGLCGRLDVAWLRVWGRAVPPAQLIALACGNRLSDARGIENVGVPPPAGPGGVLSSTALCLALCMREGSGATVPAAAAEDDMHSVEDPPAPAVSPEGGDVPCGIPRSEWAAELKGDGESPGALRARLRRGLCAVCISLCILYARESLLALWDALHGPGRQVLHGAPPPDVNAAEHPSLLPAVLCSSVRLSNQGCDPGSVDTIRRAAQHWLQRPGTTPQDARDFVSGCLGLLSEGPDTYCFETPTHPYTPREVITRTVDIPGASSYTISFDPRCRTLDYLYFYADRSQKVQVAKFPDSQGQWAGLELPQPAFFFKFSADSGAPSYWGYRFICAVKSRRFEAALELLLAVVRLVREPGSSVQPEVVLNGVVAAQLTAACMRETGEWRRMAAAVLGHMLGRCGALFPAHAAPYVDGIAAPIRGLALEQLGRERDVPVLPGSVPRSYSAALQSLVELLVAAETARHQWYARGLYAASGPGPPWGGGRLGACYAPSRISGRCSAAAMRCGPGGAVREDGPGRFVVGSAGRQWGSALCTAGAAAGQWYFEVRVLGGGHAGAAHVGVADDDFVLVEPDGMSAPGCVGCCENSWGICGGRGVRLLPDGTEEPYPAGGAALKWKARDVLGVLIDLDRGFLSYALNGQFLGECCPLPAGRRFYPAVSVGPPQESCALEVNLGAAPLAFYPGCGYLPIDRRGAQSVLGSPRSGQLPLRRLGAFVAAARALETGTPLPPFIARALEQESAGDRSTRDGPEVVEVIALAGRPRVVPDGSVSSQGTACVIRGTVRVSRSGKWYYEVTVESEGSMQVGWVTDAYTADPGGSRRFLGEDAQSWAYDGYRMLLLHDTDQRQVTRGAARAWRPGDVVGCLLDLDAREMRWTLNGEPLMCCGPAGADIPAAYTAFSGVDSTEWFCPAVSLDLDNSCKINFGATPLEHLPTGFRPTGSPAAVADAVDAEEDEAALFLAAGAPPPAARGAAFARDAAIMHLVNSLCEAQRSGAQLLPTITASRLAELGLSNLDPAEVNGRFAVMRHFNMLFRHVYPYVNLTHGPPWAGLVAEAVLSCRPLLFSTTVQNIISHHCHATNAVAEGPPAKLTINRRRAQAHRADPSKAPDGSPSIFAQVFSLLGDRHPSMFFSSRRFWTVVFQGEGAEDVGGPYRECLSDICQELMSGAMPLFIPSANARNNAGTHRDRWVLSPRAASSEQLSQLRFLGRLMAGCLRAQEPLPLYLEPALWKRLCGEAVGASDLESRDRQVLRSLQCFLQLSEAEGVTPEMFADVYEGTFTTHLSSGDEVEVVPGGTSVPVTLHNRRDYVQLVIDTRLNEARAQLDALLQGFNSVLPPHFAHLLTAQEAERMVCGRADWDVAELRANARYDGLSPSDRCVRFFWEVLEGFSVRDKGLFLRFLSGRERAPVRLKLMPLATRGDPDQYLPVASTCFFWISLPDYSSLAVMRDKLLYAVRNCADMDNDYRVRGSIDEEAGPALGTGEQGDDDDYEDYTHLL
eukprot:TRINITY_DN14980_c0_g1_i1.p1 TRINITY_DN14980_c0_g1~~TRINITY_DN14980_c0_g1_i1.p1  ORF type:complete len:2892 (+),score=968.84 TRINITY_DN14980_c0_g1_i1:1033-8676(+)